MSKKIEIDREKIVPIYERTKSVNQTAKELGIGWSTCKRILDEYSIETFHHSNQFGEYFDLDCFSSIQTEADAYWLGVMYSDGWIRSDRNCIGFGSTDKCFVESFIEYTGTKNSLQVKESGKDVGRILPDGHEIQSSKTFYSVEFSSKTTKANLIKLGCFPKKSLILGCPSEEQVPSKLLWHFLRGYIDGDGWIRYNLETHRYQVGLMGTQKFLEEITQRLSINHYGKIRKTDSKICEFSIYKRKLVEEVLQNIYKDATIYLPRKYEKCSSIFGRSSG